MLMDNLEGSRQVPEYLPNYTLHCGGINLLSDSVMKEHAVFAHKIETKLSLIEFVLF